MRLDEYAQYDALGLAGLVRRRQVHPRELAQLAIAAVEAVNPRINAVLETYPERAEALSGSLPPHGPV